MLPYAAWHTLPQQILTPLGCVSGDFFGERALLKADRRAASVIAISAEVQCLVLGRDDFNRILGPLEALMRRTMDEREAREQAVIAAHGHSADAAKAAAPAIAHATAESAAAFGDPSIDFADLHMVATLGTGTFGRVRLVVHRPSNRVFALKSLMKAHVVDTHQQVCSLGPTQSHPHTLCNRGVILRCDSST